MTSESFAKILNVGHGNAALIRDGEFTILVDTGGHQAGLKVLEYLREHGITEINTLVLSHADEDHIGSAPTILLAPDIRVGQVLVNTDATKRTEAFQELRAALKTSRREKNTHICAALTTAQSSSIKCKNLRVEILFPPPEYAVSGPGGIDLEENGLTTNSMSAVVRFSHPDGTSIVLPADCDEGALNFWDEEKIDVISTVVVFPHHGGRPGRFDPGKFAERFTGMTTPSYVVFSIHVSKHALPRQDVVAAILDRVPSVLLACTQVPDHIIDSRKIK